MNTSITPIRVKTLLSDAAANVLWRRPAKLLGRLTYPSWVALGLSSISTNLTIDAISQNSDFIRELLYSSLIHFSLSCALILVSIAIVIQGVFTLVRCINEALGQLLRRSALDETSIRVLLSSAMLFSLIAAVVTGNRLDHSFTDAGQRADAEERLQPLWQTIQHRVDQLLPAGFVRPTGPEAPNLAELLRCKFVKAAYYVDNGNVLHLLDRSGPETAIRLADWAPHHQRLLTHQQALERSRGGDDSWKERHPDRTRTRLIDTICFGDGSGRIPDEYRPDAIVLPSPSYSGGTIVELDAGKRRLGIWLSYIHDPDGVGALLESRGIRGSIVLSQINRYDSHWDYTTISSPLWPGRVPIAIHVDRKEPSAGLLGLALCLLATVGTGWELIRQLSLLWKARAIAVAQSNFVSSITHEMRTPVATIKLYTELLEAGAAEPGLERADMLSTIKQECDRLATTIENVLGFSRLRQGKWAYQFASVQARDLVLEAVQASKPLLQSRGMTYTISCLQDLTVEADREAIHQVLTNLITNAAKYAADGKELIVSVAPEGGDRLAFEVLDFGPGIPAAEQQRIFQPFYRVGDEFTRTQMGSGLGLALVQAHVKAHHGSITLTSTPELGTSFRICLPVQQPVMTKAGRSGET